MVEGGCKISDLIVPRHFGAYGDIAVPGALHDACKPLDRLREASRYEVQHECRQAEQEKDTDENHALHREQSALKYRMA